jgi:hypothetical protein
MVKNVKPLEARAFMTEHVFTPAVVRRDNAAESTFSASRRVPYRVERRHDYSEEQTRERRGAACLTVAVHVRRQPTITANGERRHGTSTAKPARSNSRFSSASGTYTSSSAHDS